MYCWAKSSLGEESTTAPKLTKFFTKRQSIKKICSSVNQTLYLLEDGSVYGSLETDDSRQIPQKVSALETQTIKKIATGFSFAVALNSHGHVYVWGFVCIGVKFARPSIIRIDTDTKIVNIAAGYNFILMLSDDGRVYSMGQNDYGQLGVENKRIQSRPVLVESLEGLPVIQVACGSHHSIALTASGFVFAFGRNNSGQLGLGDTDNKVLPNSVKYLEGRNVCYVSCGKEFTAVLTTNGKLFTSGAFGSVNQLTPNFCLNLAGNIIAQVVLNLKTYDSLTFTL